MYSDYSYAFNLVLMMWRDDMRVFLQGDLPCKRGCYCPVGMVRNSKGICIHPDDCPCSFGDREYEQGSVTSVGCNEWCVIKNS